MNFHTFYLTKKDFEQLLKTTRLKPTLNLLNERKIDMEFKNSETGLEFIEEPNLE